MPATFAIEFKPVFFSSETNSNSSIFDIIILLSATPRSLFLKLVLIMPTSNFTSERLFHDLISGAQRDKRG